MINDYLMWVWVGVFVFAIIFEFVTEEIVSIWFAIGAVPAFILSLFDEAHWGIQIAVFFAVSAIFLFLTRPLIIKKMKKNEFKTNIDTVVGDTAVVTKEILPPEYGTVKLNSLIWTAVSEDEVGVGENVEVLSVQGNKLIVKKK